MASSTLVLHANAPSYSATACHLPRCSLIPVLFFFFLMTRPPPRSPLFPSTTLSRSTTGGGGPATSRPMARYRPTGSNSLGAVLPGWGDGGAPPRGEGPHAATPHPRSAVAMAASRLTC